MDVEKTLHDLISAMEPMWDSASEQWGGGQLGHLEDLVGEINVHQRFAETASRIELEIKMNTDKLKKRIIQLLQVSDNYITRSRLRRLQKMNAPTLIFLVLAYTPDELLNFLTTFQFVAIKDHVDEFWTNVKTSKSGWLAMKQLSWWTGSIRLRKRTIL